MSHWMNTAAGRRFDFMTPRPEYIDLVAIAIALSHQARFAGNTRRHYSVLTHSICVYETVRAMGGTEIEQKWALLHDAAEAITTDIPHPFKSAGLVGMMIEVERGIQNAIADRFGLPRFMPGIVQVADLEMLACESAALCNRHPDWLAGLAKPSEAAVKTFALRNRLTAQGAASLFFLSAARFGMAPLDELMTRYSELVDPPNWVEE